MLEKEVQNYVSFSVLYIICTGIICLSLIKRIVCETLIYVFSYAAIMFPGAYIPKQLILTSFVIKCVMLLNRSFGLWCLMQLSTIFQLYSGSWTEGYIECNHLLTFITALQRSIYLYHNYKFVFISKLHMESWKNVVCIILSQADIYKKQIQNKR